jgi:hypothetical protein
MSDPVMDVLDKMPMIGPPNEDDADVTTAGAPAPAPFAGVNANAMGTR